MCEFISWIKLDNEIVYLNDDCLKDKKGRELRRHLGKAYKEDVKGHGAIRWYYDIEDNVGVNQECESANIKNYPKQIIEDIKNCKFKEIGFNLGFLTELALKKYQDIKQPAYEKYLDIEQPAWKKYEDIQQPALKKYQDIKQSALKKYQDIEQPAWKKYEDIKQSAYEKYLDIEQPAWKKYQDIKKPAWKKYQDIQQPAFWDLFSVKKNRIKTLK